MPSGPEFPAFLKLQYKRGEGVETAFIGEIAGTLGAAKRPIDRFSADTRKTLDAAMGPPSGRGFLTGLEAVLGNARGEISRFNLEARRLLDVAVSSPRNASGSLNLNPAGIQATAAAQQARAAAARELAAATETAARAEGRFDSATQLAVAGLRQEAVAQEQAAVTTRAHAQAVQGIQVALERQAAATDFATGATRRASAANDNARVSAGQHRAGLAQLSFQINDVAGSMAAGTPPAIIFAQQAGQTAQAMQLLGGSARGVGAFLGGPWGIGLTAAGIVLAPFIAKLFAAKSAADEVKFSSYGLSDAQSVLGEVMDIATGKIEHQSTALSALARAQALAGQIKARSDVADARSELGNLAAIRPHITGGFGGGLSINRGRDATGDIAAGLLEGSLNTAEAVAGLNSLQHAGISTEAAFLKAAASVTKFGVAQENLRAFQSVERMVTGHGTAADRELLLKPRKSGARSGLYGAEIDLAQAKSIATGAGFTVTSDFRTRATQQWLYDHKRTATNPVALPGTSAHERGNALDIAFGNGVSPATLRKAYDDVGVHLTKILKEDGHFHIEWSTKGADKVEREATQLAEFGQRTAETIARVTSQFDDQPRVIDRVTAATRELDAVIADLSKRKPAGFEGMIAQAKEAEALAASFVDREIAHDREKSEHSIAVRSLALSGREDEAAVLDRIYQTEEKMGTLTAAQRVEVTAQVMQEQRVNRELERRAEIQNLYLSATRSVKQELGAILSGQGKLSNIRQTFQQLSGQILGEKLSGQAFRDLDKWIQQQSGISRSVDFLSTETERAGQCASNFADVMAGVTARLGGGGAAGGLAAGDPLAQSFDATFAKGGGAVPIGAAIATAAAAAIQAERNAAPGGAANDNGDIVVNGRRERLSPNQVAHEMGFKVATSLTDALNNQFNTKLFSKIRGPLGGAFEGYATTGTAFGTALGAARMSKGLSQATDNLFKSTNVLGRAFGGAQTGSMVQGIASAVGIHLNKTGSQIGGAIGSFIPIPGGQIIGAIAGGIIGNLFGKSKTGASAIGLNSYGYAGSTGVGGNNAQAKAATAGLTGNVSDKLNQIADALGAQLGSFSVAIGQRKDEFRVSASGNVSNTTAKHTNSDIIYKGKDENAAIAAALQNAIQDGAIKGISAASQNILRSGQDLNRAIQKAVSIESIPKRLKALTDPVGSALDTLNTEFATLVANLTEGGATAAQFADAQKLYGLERAKAIKDASDQLTGSLRGLYDELTVGNDALSLRGREAAALAKYNPLADRVKAGDTSAYGDFADAARSLLGIERQLNGSQPGYFAASEAITALTKGTLDQQAALINAATGSDSPFAKNAIPADNQPVVDAIGVQTYALIDALGGRLDAVNQNLGSLIANGNSVGTPFPRFANSTSFY